jgi:hypothetical protein
MTTSRKRQKKRLAVLMLGIMLGASACLVPPFSDLQSAKLVGKGRVELTPHYSSITASGEDGSDHIQDNFGIQAGFGVTKLMDFRMRFEFLRHSDSGEKYDESFLGYVFGFGPKFILIKDWLALFLPIGFAYGEDIKVSETWEFHPTVLFTIPVSQAFEINTSAKSLIPYRKKQNTFYALNLGLGIGRDLRQWAFRPEIGILFDPEGDKHYFHFSLGFTYKFGRIDAI